jgi:hypothetical protein
MNEIQLPHEIEGEIVREPQSYAWLWMVLLAIILVGAMLLIRWWRRRAKQPVNELTAAEAVRRRMAAAQTPAPDDRMALRTWAGEWSEIMRAAIELRHQIPASDRTTDELEVLLRSIPALSPDIARDFQQTLRGLDAVQFADAGVDHERLGQLHSQAWRITEALLGWSK